METEDGWTIEYHDDALERFVRSLPRYEQRVLYAALVNVLQVCGIGICSGEWGKPLGGGLYEFRVRKSLHTILAIAGENSDVSVGTDRPVLLRVFCTFYGNRIVLLFHGYDKRRDPSARRQAREIAKARKMLHEWKANSH